jgi:hypothetical protein
MGRNNITDACVRQRRSTAMAAWRKAPLCQRACLGRMVTGPVRGGGREQAADNGVTCYSTPSAGFWHNVHLSP